MFSFLLILMISPPVLSQEADVYEIVDTIDKLYRSKTSRSRVEMTIETENWSRTLTMDMWTEGLNKTFIHITAPKKDAGISTLRIEREMWNFFPKINKVMKVPPSMMMSSWMGSDFTNDDIVKESSMVRDYTLRLITPEESKPEHYSIELVPKEGIPIVWGKIILVVDRNDYTPVKQLYFDEKGRKMRVMEFSEVKMFSGRRIPSVLEMRTLNKKGKKTVIRYNEIHFDVQLERDVFTLRNLQRKR